MPVGLCPRKCGTQIFPLSLPGDHEQGAAAPGWTLLASPGEELSRRQREEPSGSRKGCCHRVIEAFLVPCCPRGMFGDKGPKEGDVPWHLPELPRLYCKEGVDLTLSPKGIALSALQPPACPRTEQG